MHHNRIAKHLTSIGLGTSSPATAEVPHSACAFCLIAFAMNYWQHQVYCAAYEMALAANQPNPLDRILAVSAN